MKKENLRIVFMGTPEFAVETLKALVENEYNVVAVVTQPDKACGEAPERTAAIGGEEICSGEGPASAAACEDEGPGVRGTATLV